MAKSSLCKPTGGIYDSMYFRIFFRIFGGALILIGIAAIAYKFVSD